MSSRGDISISRQGKSDEATTIFLQPFNVEYAMGNLTPEKN
jgi:hypothetical protein